MNCDKCHQLEATIVRLQAILRHAIPVLEALYAQEKMKPYQEHSPELKASIESAVMGMREEVMKRESLLEKHLAVYNERLQDLLNHGHKGRFLLVCGEEWSIYCEQDEAIAEGYHRYGIKPFLVKEITDQETPVRV